MSETVTVAGIGADGWAGLCRDAREAITSADVVYGGPRQLALIGDHPGKRPWPSPLLPALDGLFDEPGRICVLASGDPMLAGIGTTLVRRLGADRVRILPSVSSVALARARLGWSAEETEVVRVVGHSADRVTRALAPGARLLVLSGDASTPATLAALLRRTGYGPSRLTVLEELGGPAENQADGTADDWDRAEGAALNLIAVDCELAPCGQALPTLPGLPDDAYEHDGQLTKRDLRALALARLAPAPGELLWDVGAGAGSVGIEWMRAHPRNRAIAVERDPGRAARIDRNATALGVPDLDVVVGEAPGALSGLAAPDAVFVGGGLTTALAECLAAQPKRLVAHGVTVEAEQLLAAAHRDHGGELTRVAVEQAAPLGGFTGWTPSRTVTQWSVTP
ncbi:precorrin-6y C5,15-methyltransferase (decarboxylating) subunit CbiE [Amycolatopsis sp. CA-230715]|uniref:precorrin-6y C5,15-methyltransferase (decarboxylating) subunit CbiE n=1 Tax=Amycolatopsis sp. CA-230715 TaxID=2745196 RepID=UPI003FA455CE